MSLVNTKQSLGDGLGGQLVKGGAGRGRRRYLSKLLLVSLPTSLHTAVNIRMKEVWPLMASSICCLLDGKTES